MFMPGTVWPTSSNVYRKRADRRNGRCEPVNNTCTNVYTQLANTGITNWLGVLTLKFGVLSSIVIST